MGQGAIAKAAKTYDVNNTFILNFTCPHSGKDIEGFSSLPAVGRPTGNMKARVDALGITPVVVFCNGDWSAEQSFTEQGILDERVNIQDDINNGGYNGKMVSIPGNHIAVPNEGLDHFNLSVWETLDLESFPYTINSDPDAVYPFERFYFLIGNTIHIGLGDRNDLPYPYGKAGTQQSGGHPNGAITLDTIEWLTEILIKYRDYTSFIYVHEGIAETTVATGYGDGTIQGHNPIPIEEGSGNIYTVYDEDTDTPYNQTSGNNWFLDLLKMWPSAYRFVSQGHSHAQPGFSINGRDLFHEEGEAFFFNCGSLTMNHGAAVHDNDPHFTMFELKEGALECVFHKVSLYGQDRHGETFAQGEVITKYRRSKLLKYPYKGSYTPVSPTLPAAPISTNESKGAEGITLTWESDSDLMMILHRESGQPTKPTELNVAPGFNTPNGDRVVYIGDGNSFLDEGVTTGNYLFVPINASGGQANF